MTPLRFVVVVGAMTYCLLNPGVLEGPQERLYMATISTAHRHDAAAMFKLTHQVRKVEKAYETHRLRRAETRAKLLKLIEQYERLLGHVDQSGHDRYEREELIVKIRDCEQEINTWGRQHGF